VHHDDRYQPPELTPLGVLFEKPALVGDALVLRVTAAFTALDPESRQALLSLLLDRGDQGEGGWRRLHLYDAGDGRSIGRFSKGAGLELERDPGAGR
jgi:hypothetical protein